MSGSARQWSIPPELELNVDCQWTCTQTSLKSLTWLSEISWNVGQWSQWSQWSTKILYDSFIFPVGSTQFSISQPEDPTGGAGSGRSGRSAGIWPTSIGPIGLESCLKWSEILRPDETLFDLFDEVWYTSTKIVRSELQHLAAIYCNCSRPWSHDKIALMHPIHSVRFSCLMWVFVWKC